MIPGGHTRRGLWMIRLRWWAAVAVIVGGVIISQVPGLSISTAAIVGTGVGMVIYNLSAFTAIKRGFPARTVNVAQMGLDLGSLTVLIFLSGGVENPLLVYFVFHLVIAGMTLSRRGVYAAAAAVFLVVTGAVILSYHQVIPHVSLWGSAVVLYRNPFYVMTMLGAWGSTLFFLAYVASSLRRQLDQRHQDLVEANLLLKEKDLMKSRYVMTVAHDLKSPLSSVESCLEVVRTGLAGPITPQTGVLLDRASANCQMVLELADDLLLLSHIRTSETRTGRTDVKETARSLESDLAARAREEGITLAWDIEPELPPVVGIQGRALYHVARNLVENALRYTSRDGRVDVRIKSEQDGVSIQVEDTGMGISQEEIAHVFDEFYRGSRARSRCPLGTGLGLTIVRELVERAGGSVSVTSIERRGTCFTIRLPVSERGDPDEGDEGSPISSHHLAGGRGLGVRGERKTTGR